MDIGDLFSFDKRLTPQIIKPVYWIGCALIVIEGLYLFLRHGLGGLLSDFFSGIGYMVFAVFFVIIATLALRILTEVVLALFEVHDKVGAGSPSSPVGTNTTTS